MYLTWENLVSGYQRNDPLHVPFSGEIRTPGIYAILGPNGCGKSTLMKSWLGLMKPLQGNVTLNDSPVQGAQHMAQGIGYVPQFHKVNRYFHITVQDFVKQGFGPQHKNTPETQARIEQLLVQWQLDGYAQRSFHDLSMGQKTRAMVARTIVTPPKLLFLDEPLASLDRCCQWTLMKTLQNLTLEKNVCVFMIEHHLENFEEMIAGKVVFERTHDRALCTVQCNF
jgi:ABC-type Mn2+/Zn2+ transport system ATPase subunit